MPSVVGNIKINSVGPSSNVQIGDAVNIVLSSSAKINAGANSFSNGDSFGTLTNNQASITNTDDAALVDGTSASIV
ncbi:spore germination protein [Paenibacillus sp. UNC451MF]|uniref:spore germination protein n=1 Tax=Paenibacillus sp. UNC451MF TaxID=1449063 RepID=UPI000491A812|nr:spore germination protein [Paenibacillus sp. UNC451MF]